LQVMRLPPGPPQPNGRRAGRKYPDGGGLYLEVTAGLDHSVRRSWLFRYAVPRKVVGKSGKERQVERWMGLGPAADVSLADARLKAAECRRMRLNGIDPIEFRNAERAAQTLATAKSINFDEARDRYHKSHSAGWRSSKHIQDWKAMMER